MLSVLFLRYETMSNYRDIKKWEPIYLQEKVIEPITEVNTLERKPRYLGELANNPLANVWDYYWNTGSNVMRLFTKLWWKNI